MNEYNMEQLSKMTAEELDTADTAVWRVWKRIRAVKEYRLFLKAEEVEE